MIRKALLALALSVLCVAPAVAAVTTTKDRVPVPPPPPTASEVAAFNDSLAAGSTNCQLLIRALDEIEGYHPDHIEPGMPPPTQPPFTLWVRTAQSAKACLIQAHAGLGSGAQVPQFALYRACSELKVFIANTPARPGADPAPMAASMSSWACGWPAPLPAFRTVPSE
jgi:hypothetical protein